LRKDGEHHSRGGRVPTTRDISTDSVHNSAILWISWPSPRGDAGVA
jgi:hypothetical protein